MQTNKNALAGVRHHRRTPRLSNAECKAIAAEYDGTTAALIGRTRRAKKMQAQTGQKGDLYMSFELGDKQWKLSVGDGRSGREPIHGWPQATRQASPAASTCSATSRWSMRCLIGCAIAASPSTSRARRCASRCLSMRTRRRRRPPQPQRECSLRKRHLESVPDHLHGRMRRDHKPAASRVTDIGRSPVLGPSSSAPVAPIPIAQSAT